MNKVFTLAEGTRLTGHFATNFGKTQRLMHSAGFTLAEVLITLGVIGVVAALTIPTLIANIRSKQFSTGFKKTVSTLNQAVRMNNAQYGWDFAEVHSTLQCNANDNPENDFNYCAIVNGNLKGTTFNPYYIIVSEKASNLQSDDKADNYYQIKPYNNNIYDSPIIDATLIYSLNDGITLMFPGGTSKGDCQLSTGSSLRDAIVDVDLFPNYDYCVGYIDVNGPSLPNTEIKCTTGTTSKDLEEPCIIKNKDITDVFPVLFYDSTVTPATNAAKYVLNTAK
ncbi:type II secretion system protein [bacterium]|nr:type II secretion system protein [bacterium]